MVGGTSDLLAVSPSRSKAGKKHRQTTEDDNETFHFQRFKLCIMSNAFSRGAAAKNFAVSFIDPVCSAIFEYLLAMWFLTHGTGGVGVGGPYLL
jgi:hypothetical protein